MNSAGGLTFCEQRSRGLKVSNLLMALECLVSSVQYSSKWGDKSDKKRDKAGRAYKTIHTALLLLHRVYCNSMTYDLRYGKLWIHTLSLLTKQRSDCVKNYRLASISDNNGEILCIHNPFYEFMCNLRPQYEKETSNVWSVLSCSLTLNGIFMQKQCLQNVFLYNCW